MAFLYLAITGSITSVVMEMRMLWLTLIHIWLLFTYMNDFLQDGLMELHIVPVNMRCRYEVTFLWAVHELYQDCYLCVGYLSTPRGTLGVRRGALKLVFVLTNFSTKTTDSPRLK